MTEEWDDWSDEDEKPNEFCATKSQPATPSTLERQQSIEKMSQITLFQLQSYRLDLSSPSLRESSQTKLNEYASLNFEKLYDYYKSKKELGRYTLKTEMTRMKYTITTKDNKILSTLPEIQQHYGDGVDDDLFCFFALSDDDPDSLLWRAANQSLLGDVLEVLSGGNSVIRPSLGASAVAEKVEFNLNFQKSFVSVLGQFKIVLTDLDVAYFTVSIYLSFGDGVLKVVLEDLRPVMVMDSDLQLASGKIAKDNFALGDLSALEDHQHDMARGSNEDSLKAMKDLVAGTKHVLGGLKSKTEELDIEDLKYKSAQTVGDGKAGMLGALQMMNEATGIGKKAGAVGGGIWGGLRGIGQGISAAAEKIEKSMNEEVLRIERIEQEEKESLERAPEKEKECVSVSVSATLPDLVPPTPPILYRRENLEQAAPQQNVPEVVKLRDVFGSLFQDVKSFGNKIVNEIDASVNDNDNGNDNDNEKKDDDDDDDDEVVIFDDDDDGASLLEEVHSEANQLLEELNFPQPPPQQQVATTRTRYNNKKLA